MSDRTSVAKRAVNLTVSPRFNSYSRVVINAGQDPETGEDIAYTAGDTTGRTLELTTPWGSQQMAEDILSQLQTRNFQYQPFRATDAQLDPSAELGDGVTVNDVYSGIYTQDTNFSTLMAAEIAAPEDEEIDHEFPYIPQQQREFRRATAQSYARIALTDQAIQAEVLRATEMEGTLSSRITATADSITSEVQRATEAEGNLSSRITQTAGSISAKVDASSGDKTKKEFGWTLDAASWEIFSNKKTILKATNDGLEVTGKITATSGYIGNGSSGFEIGNKAIYNGMTALGDTTHTGIYLGTDGIALGAGKFKVTSAGKLTATDATITGKINATKGGTIGGFTIGDNNIYYGKYGKDGSVYISPNELKLGTNFVVDSNGNMTCNSANIRGTLHAGDITSSGSGDRMTGSYLTGGSVSTGKLSSSGQSGVSGGNSFLNAITPDSDVYPSVFNCATLSSIRFYLAGKRIGTDTKVVTRYSDGSAITLKYLAWQDA